MKKALTLAAVVAALGATASAANAMTATYAVYGDAPYGTTPTDTTQTNLTPSFVAAVNADPKVSRVLHVGDIHSGKQFCTQSYDQTIFDMWTQYADPVVYTPGDNEWTDCHKAGEGGGLYDPVTGKIVYQTNPDGSFVDYAAGDPIANLALIRSIFFPNVGKTLGRKHLSVTSQAKVTPPADHPEDRQFVENVIWEAAGALFVAVNLPGGSDNDTDPWYVQPTMPPDQIKEEAVRTGADLRWLDDAFTKAAADGDNGVVILTQADMWDPEKGATHQVEYEPIVASIQSHTAAFPGSVLLFNGDSHVYQSDNPFDPADPVNLMHPGYPATPNFHRVVVHGSTQPLEYTRLTINAIAKPAPGQEVFGPFRWTRVMPPVGP